jgi:tetratricopeptide (TPR) repeat protein
VERQKPLESIHALFSEPTDSEPRPVAIIGNAAEGKSELAKQYARKYEDEYHHQIFIDCGTWDLEYRKLAANWSLFPDTLLFPNKNDERPIDIDVVVLKVHSYLESQKGGKKSLIIFDNVPTDFFRQFKDRLPCHTDVLITSQDPAWGAKAFPIQMSNPDFRLTHNEGLEILKKWVVDVAYDEQAATDIVTRFSHLPAMIANAGCYINKSKVLDMKDYLTCFDENRFLLIKEGNWDYKKLDLATAIKMSLDQIKENNNAALKLLIICAHLPMSNIAYSFLSKHYSIKSVDLNTYLNLFGTLITVNEEQKEFRMHRLFQSVISELKPLQPEELSELATVCNKEGIALGELGRHDEALEYEQKALEIFRKTRGELDPDTAGAYNNIGTTLEELGRYDEALEYGQKALEIFRKTRGELHSDTARAYNNTGFVLGRLGRHNEALEYEQRALEIFRKTRGELHSDTARAYNNTGFVLGRLGRHNEALEYEQKALEIFRKTRGELHSDTARSYSNTGFVLGELGRHNEALEYELKALEIFRKTRGELHSD